MDKRKQVPTALN